MFLKILLSVDGSDHSVKAAEYAITLAKKFDSVIDAVYVVDKDTSKKGEDYAAKEIENRKKMQDATEYIRELLERSEVIYGVHVLYGNPGERIIGFAEERENDCIVIGSRGLNPLKSLILGSVSSKVVRLAPCPVLIVK